MPHGRTRARRRRPSPEEARRPDTQLRRALSPADARRVPAYALGLGPAPSVPLREPEGGGPGGAEPDGETDAGQERRIEQARGAPAAGGAAAEAEGGREPVSPVPNVTESGAVEEVEAHGQSLRLQGRTRARFSNSFRTVDVVTERGQGCAGCRGAGCVRVTGTLESTFTVATTVTLPPVPRNLSECQRERVRDAINNVLVPHEQEHVDAFNTYAGTVSTPFDMTVCSNAFNARIRAMHRAEERARRAAAQALSDALDPFHFDVDLDCEEETAAAEPEHTTAGAGSPEENA